MQSSHKQSKDKKVDHGFCKQLVKMRTMLLQGHWYSLWFCFLNQLTILQSYLLLDVWLNAALGLMIMSVIFFGRRKQIADLAGLNEELDG